MKNPVTANLSAGLALGLFAFVFSSALEAATISSFTALNGQTPTGSIAALGTGGAPPTGASDKADFTFDFTMTTPVAFSGNDEIVVEFGGGTVGTSLILEDFAGAQRLVFRSGGTGPGTMLHVTSTSLTASTVYRVTGSLFMNPSAGSDGMRLYLNEADAVDSGFTNHTPSVDMGGDWTGGNQYGYGTQGGGDHLIGTPGSPTGTGPFNAFTGNLDSDLDYYGDTFLDVGAVPEPSSFGLLAGFLCMAGLRRRRS